ncbi:MAG: hypothetical protein WC516_05315 [Patescibacteria group bacterium]|jgi:hypothetical protein
MKNAEKLIALADQLDREGKPMLADIVDQDFQEFLELLGDGKLDFDFLQAGGPRDPRGPYSNRGLEVNLSGIEGIQ